jgi:hypothetical protein
MAAKKKEADVTIVKETKRYKVKLTRDLLGTVPKNPSVYAEYIATKAPDAETAEAEANLAEQKMEQDKAEEKGWTGFLNNGKGLFIYDYMVKGFLKSALEVMMANGAITKISAYKKWIDNLVFVDPREILLGVKKPDGCHERPLRAMGPQGPRVTLVRSDFVKAGRELTFEITLLKNSKGITWDVIDQAMAFGEFVGFGQWRASGGYGRFQVLSSKML